MKHAENVTPVASEPNPTQRVMPTLRITDYARSRQFFVDGVGFRLIGNTASDRVFPCLCRYPGMAWRSF
jgi:catechol 2,3-dioxygenase-like lactoylglutathione lyase family enzyme